MFAAWSLLVNIVVLVHTFLLLEMKITHSSPSKNNKKTTEESREFPTRNKLKILHLLEARNESLISNLK